MLNRQTAAAVALTAVCCTAGSQALGSSGSVPGPAAHAAASLSGRVRALERRVNALAHLELRHVKVSYLDSPLIPVSGNASFQDGSVACSGPSDVAVGGGVAYPAGGEYSNSVMIESAPAAGDGWEATVYSPHGDDAHVYVACASFGW